MDRELLVTLRRNLPSLRLSNTSLTHGRRSSAWRESRGARECSRVRPPKPHKSTYDPRVRLSRRVFVTCVHRSDSYYPIPRIASTSNKVSAMSVHKLPQASTTRSGGRYGLAADLGRGRGGRLKTQDDDDATDRGTLRTGGSFRRVSRGHYASLTALRKAHVRLFTQEAVFVVTGATAASSSVVRSPRRLP